MFRRSFSKKKTCSDGPIVYRKMTKMYELIWTNQTMQSHRFFNFKAKALRDSIVFTCLVWISPTRIHVYTTQHCWTKLFLFFILFYFILMDYFYYYNECFWTKPQPHLLIFFVVEFFTYILEEFTYIYIYIYNERNDVYTKCIR